MEDQAPDVSSTTQTSLSQTTLRRREGRGAWVLTCYGISGLILFAILAYFFSNFVAH